MSCRQPQSKSLWRMLVAVAVLGCAPAGQAAAHEGPPFPILMDKPAANYVVSVWADPDIGEAQFYVVVESPEGKPPPDAPNVSMWVEPVSGRLQRVTYQAERQKLRGQMQFESEPYFDRRDMWTVGFRIEAPDGTTEELHTEVESTPPGTGPWDFAIYLFPFVLIGGLWALGMVRRMKWRQHLKATQQTDQSHGDCVSAESEASDDT